MHFGLRIAGEKEALKATSMTIEKLTTKSIEALKNAESMAKLKGHQLLEPGHIFKAIIEIEASVIPFSLRSRFGRRFNEKNCGQYCVFVSKS